MLHHAAHGVGPVGQRVNSGNKQVGNFRVFFALFRKNAP